MTFSVYILRSERFDRYYIGQTNNLKLRVEIHNSPKAKWTKRYQPWVLTYIEEFESRSSAVRRERYLKSLKNISKFLKEIETNRSQIG